MSKAPSKKSLADAGRRKVQACIAAYCCTERVIGSCRQWRCISAVVVTLAQDVQLTNIILRHSHNAHNFWEQLEAFQRAKAEGAAAKKAKGPARLGRDAEVAVDDAVAAAGESLPQGSRVSELQSDGPSTSFSAAASLSQHGGVRQPDPGGAAWASSSLEAGATAGPASLAAMATAEPASAPPQSAAGDSRPDLPLPAAAAKSALLSKPQPYVVSPVAAAAAAAPAAAGLSDNSSEARQVDSQYQHLPQVPQQPPSTHSATAASLSPGLADRIRGSDLQQRSPSPGLASSPPALDHDAAVRLADRASFEASHSPFIALSRTASGRMSTGSVAHDSDLGGDVTSRSSHTSRLASVTQSGEDITQLSAAAPGELMIRPMGSGRFRYCCCNAVQFWWVFG
jgi:hypothetical protein